MVEATGCALAILALLTVAAAVDQHRAEQVAGHGQRVAGKKIGGQFA